MLDIIGPFFSDLNARTGLNFNVFYDPYEYGRFINGAAISVQLILWSLLLSLVIGVVGAWVQNARSAALRGIVNSYIQAFRNTPPMIQLLFFYFGWGRSRRPWTWAAIRSPSSLFRLGDHLARDIRRSVQRRDLQGRAPSRPRTDA